MEQLELFCRWQALLLTVNNKKEKVLAWVPVSLVSTVEDGRATILYGTYRCIIDSSMLRAIGG